MKLGIFTRTRNSLFIVARQRIQPRIVELKKRLSEIAVDGRHNNLMLTFVDESPNFLRITRRGAKDDIFEADAGYDFQNDFPPDDDVLVVQLIEEKLKKIIESDHGFGPKRAELLQAIMDWTTDAIGA